VTCVILGVQLKYVCSMLSCVGLQLLFVHFRCLLLVGFCYGFCGEEKNQRIRTTPIVYTHTTGMAHFRTKCDFRENPPSDIFAKVLNETSCTVSPIIYWFRQNLHAMPPTSSVPQSAHSRSSVTPRTAGNCLCSGAQRASSVTGTDCAVQRAGNGLAQTGEGTAQCVAQNEIPYESEQRSFNSETCSNGRTDKHTANPWI